MVFLCVRTLTKYWLRSSALAISSRVSVPSEVFRSPNLLLFFQLGLSVPPERQIVFKLPAQASGHQLIRSAHSSHLWLVYSPSDSRFAYISSMHAAFFCAWLWLPLSSRSCGSCSFFGTDLGIWSSISFFRASEKKLHADSMSRFCSLEFQLIACRSVFMAS